MARLGIQTAYFEEVCMILNKGRNFFRILCVALPDDPQNSDICNLHNMYFTILISLISRYLTKDSSFFVIYENLNLHLINITSKYWQVRCTAAAHLWWEFRWRWLLWKNNWSFCLEKRTHRIYVVACVVFFHSSYRGNWAKCGDIYLMSFILRDISG